MFYSIMIAAAAGTTVAMSYAIACGNVVVAAALPTMLSPGGMWFCRHFLERGNPAGLFSPRTQSWAFMFGDPLAIGVAFGAIVAAANHNTSVWWLAISLLMTTGISVAWRYAEMRAYQASDAADLLGSPSKLWHDLVVYPVFTFVLIYEGLPVVIDWQEPGWVLAAAMGGWATLAVADGVRKLNPKKLHPRAEYTLHH